MQDLILHAVPRKQLNDFCAEPSHALILIANPGAGKRTLGLFIAAKLLNMQSLQELRRYPYFISLKPTDSVITIESVRHIKQQLRLKTIGVSSIRRVVLIEDSHTMTIEAQNAFLKLLEEPPSDTVIIMTVSGLHSLLPTVYSRTQQITLRPVAKTLLFEHFTKLGYSPENIEKTYHMSNGQIGLMTALLSEDAAHPLIPAISLAKELLAAPLHDRLVKIDDLAKQKQLIPQLLQALQRIVRVALLQASKADNTKEVQRWHTSSLAIHQTIIDANRSANTKLLLTKLFLSL